MITRETAFNLYALALLVILTIGIIKHIIFSVKLFREVKKARKGKGYYSTGGQDYDSKRMG